MWGLLALLAMPAAAQNASPVTATLEDAERVHLTFQTIDLLADRCAEETGDAAGFTAARTGWMERNASTMRLVERLLEHLEAEVDQAALAPRAAEDTEALLESIMPGPELCRNYLASMTAGEMDLRTVVPDLYNRLVLSDGAIAAMDRKP
jgi:hypothetical protein